MKRSRLNTKPVLPWPSSPRGSAVVPAIVNEEIAPHQREQLAAYGLVELRNVRVLQQRPMTVILVEEVELAREHAVARHLWVESTPPA